LRKGHWTAPLLCLALGFPLIAPAQETALPPVTVPLPPADVPLEAPSRRDPSGAITIVETRDHQGEAKETAELLAPTPGVMTLDQGGFGQAKLLSIRGASSNGVLLFLDGIPLNGAGGNADLSLIPPAIVERFEVLRGAAGAKYGSGGLGGAIDVRTRALGGGSELFAELAHGSFATWLAQLGASAAIGEGDGMLLLHISRSAGDFSYPFNDRPQLPGSSPIWLVRENNDASLGGALLKYRSPLGRRWTLDALGELSLDSRGLAGPVENPTPDARETGRRISSTARLTHSFAERGEISSRVYLRQSYLSLRGGYFGSGLESSDWAIGGEVAISGAIGSLQQWSAAATVEWEALTQEPSANPSRYQVGLLVSDEILLFSGALSLIPSLRLDRAGHFNGFSPKMGALLTLPSGFELRANVGSAFRAPSFLELYVPSGSLLPNPDLQPERALQADVGFAHRTRLSFLSTSVFGSRYENLISYEYYPPLLAKPYNIDSAQLYGLEVEGELKPSPLVSTLVGYTLLFSENLREDPRYYLKELPYRPRHKLHARVSAGPRLARARAELNFQSQQYFNRTETLSIPARSLLNLGISSQLTSSPEMTASIEVKNVLDVHSQDFDGYPLPGRAVYLTVRIAYERPAQKGNQ